MFLWKALKRIIGCCWAYRFTLCVLIVSIVSGLSQYVFLRRDNSFSWVVMMEAIGGGLHYYYFFQGHTFLDFIKEIYAGPYWYYYSPSIPLMYALFISIFGVYTNMEVMMNSFFLMVGLFGIYKSGSLLFNKRMGIIAALVWSVLPVIVNERNWTYYEFPLMCVAPWMLFCLLKSDSFRSLKWSVAFGLVFAFMLNIKHEGIIFGVIPFGYLAVATVKHIRKKQSSLFWQWRNALIGACAGVIVCLHGNLMNWQTVVHYWMSRQEFDGQWWQAITWRDQFYFDLLWSGELIPRWLWVAALILTAVSIVWICFRGLRNETVHRILYVGLYASIPLMVFTCIQMKGVWHIYVMTPFIVLIIIGGVHLIKNRYVRLCVITLFILWASIGHYVAFCSSTTRAKINTAIQCLSSNNVDISKLYGTYLEPVTIEWKKGCVETIDCLLNDLAWSQRTISEQQGQQQVAVLGVLEGLPFGGDSLRLYLLRKAQVPLFGENVPITIMFGNLPKIEYGNYDYIIVLENAILAYEYSKTMVADIKNKESDFWRFYQLLDEVTIEPSEKIMIFKSIKNAIQKSGNGKSDGDEAYAFDPINE